MAILPQSTGCRFGPYELDLRSGDLSRSGRRIRLQEKPRSILLALAERPGGIVLRSELRDRLWPGDTFVDFEDGLNTAMRKLREVLEDDPQAPRYIETIRGRGYRLIAQLEPIGAELESTVVDETPDLASTARLGEASEPISRNSNTLSSKPAAATPRRTLRLWLVAFGSFAIFAALGLWSWFAHSSRVLSASAHDAVLIADFDNQTGDPRFDHALQTALTVGLEQSHRASILSRFQIQNALHLMAAKPDEPVTAAVGREICQREDIAGLIVPAITRTGQEYLLTAQLIDPASGDTVRSYSQPAHGENHILSALDSITVAIRRDLGESKYQIHSAHRPLPQVTTGSMEALEDYANGTVKWAAGRSGEAEALYKAAISADPDFAMAHAALGYAYCSFHFNEPALGEAEFRKALNLSSRTTLRERSLIEIRYAESQGRIEDAFRLLQAYLQQYPGDWDARYGYARLLRMHGHTQESVNIFQEVLRQSPDAAGIYIELATAYSQLGQTSQSVQIYEKAFSLDPHLIVTGNVNREYGFALVRDGEEAKAEQVFSALLADPDNYANGERSLAFLDLYHGRYESARQRLDLALAKTTEPYSVARIRYMLAVVAAGQGNRREQIAQLDKIAANLDALALKVLYGSLVGQAYARSGEIEKARALLLKIAPLVNERKEDQVASVQLLSAEVAVASGDFPTALKSMKPPGPNDSASLVTLTRESLAHNYQQMGKFDDATAWYEQFVTSSNDDALGWEPQQQLFEAYYMLAKNYQQKKGNRAEAMAALTKLLDHWHNADTNVVLLRNATSLRSQLMASNGIPSALNQGAPHN